MKTVSPLKHTVAVLSALTVILGFLPAAFGQDAAPLNESPTASDIPTNAIVREGEEFPLPGQATPPDSPAPSASFQGLDDNNTNIPPDTQGAVGPNHVLTMLNSQVRIQNRAGTTNYSTVSLASFWSGLGTFSSIFDPKVVYDPYANRWIAVTLADHNLSSSSVLLGVSQTSDPTGSWYLSRYDADSNDTVYADYPSLGFNKDWVVVNINAYTNSNNRFSHAEVWVFNRTNVYAGGTTHTNFSLTQNFGGTVSPAVTYDTNLATVYLLQTWAPNLNSNGYLRMYTITGAVASPNLVATANFPQITPWGHTPVGGDIDFAPQTNTTVKIRNGDSRVRNVVFRNGYIWCAQTIFLPAESPTHSAVQWWQITTSGNVVQFGRIEDSAGIKFYAYPSIAVNRYNDVLIGYSRFSTNQYASGNYSFRAFSDTLNVLQNERLLKAGEGRYYKTFGIGANRWGDYSSTVVDPVNDTDLWTLQEYAATPVGSGLTDGDGRWGTWWGQIALPGPVNDNFTNAIVVSGAQGATNTSNVRATKEPGEPNHAGNTGGASVWYQWTAPTNGSAIVETYPSGFDSVLAVYTGTSVTNLTSIASDHGSFGNGSSHVNFTATAGTTYRIAIDGFNGAMGTATFNWVQPYAPIFTLQPESQAKYTNDPLTFTSHAEGIPSPSYQWRFNGTDIFEATDSAYFISNVRTNDAGNYTVVASNPVGSVTSIVAVLRVLTSEATLSAPLRTNNNFQFTVSRVTNVSYIVQASTNLAVTNWTAIATNTAPFTITDTFTNYPQRFYRAIKQ